MEQLTRPLFRFDPGWLFIAAGLSICAAGVILPAQENLHSLQRQLEQLRDQETQAYARLKAHSDFMDQVDRADPALIRRLAATQLNMVPEGDTPVLLAASLTLPVTHWIDSTLHSDIRPPKTAPNSTLSRLASGPHRLWLFGGGIMSVFIGLVLGPATSRRARVVVAAEPDVQTDVADDPLAQPSHSVALVEGDFVEPCEDREQSTEMESFASAGECGSSGITAEHEYDGTAVVESTADQSNSEPTLDFCEPDDVPQCRGSHPILVVSEDDDDEEADASTDDAGLDAHDHVHIDDDGDDDDERETDICIEPINDHPSFKMKNRLSEDHDQP